MSSQVQSPNHRSHRNQASGVVPSFQGKVSNPVSPQQQNENSQQPDRSGQAQQEPNLKQNENIRLIHDKLNENAEAYKQMYDIYKK